MAYSFLGHTAFQPTSGSTGTGTATTAAVDTTGADLIVALLAYNVNVSDPLVTDSKVNIWNALTVRSATNRAQRLSWMQPGTVGASHTFTAIPPASNYLSIYVAWFAGSLASTPFDAENGTNNGGGASGPLSTGTVTPFATSELFIAGIATDAGASAAMSGYTVTDAFDINAGPFSVGGALAYKIKTDAVAETPSWNWTGSQQAAISLSAFKVTAGGVAFLPRPGLLVKQAVNRAGTY